MAGIGIRLNRIFEKNTIAAYLHGFGYSASVTIAPMAIVIAVFVLMENVLGFSKSSYTSRELFSCTILYAFVFSLLCTTPFNAALSRYLSDAVFEERYADIRPCYYLGLLLNLLPACALGIPFSIREYLVGGVALYYVFTGFCGYISMVLTFYLLRYLSLCKYYRTITGYFFTGMTLAFVCSCVFVFVLDMEVPYSMLLGMTIGFFIIACMEYATVRRFFPENSNHYRSLLKFFVGSRDLILANAFYMLGLYVHNFVFWSTDMHMVAADSFVCAQSYDMAAFIAMLTNISSTIIFTVGVEMRFHSRYRAYTEAVVGGRVSDIRLAKSSMIEQIGGELGRLVRTQFIISVMIFLVCQIFLPAFGFSGLVMRIYPCLAAGFFIVFMMYAEMVFLYYFDDLKGSMAVAALFCLVTFAGSVLATQLTAIWYGLGLLLGGLAGWVAGYARLSWITRHLERHIFCRGSLLKKRKGKKPSGKVYERMENRA